MNERVAGKQTTDVQLRQGERLSEGLAWWGIITAIIAVAVGGVNSSGGVIYLLAAIAAVTTIVWFHLVPKPFEYRPAVIIAMAILLATISAFNYYTGGVHSPLFVLYYVPLLAAFFLFRPKLQLILGAAEHACFVAQFLVPVLFDGVTPDWTTFLFRSLQLAALGFAAYYAARSARGKISVFQRETESIARREKKLMSVAERSQELGSSNDFDAVISQTLSTASSLFESKMVFLVRAVDDEPERQSSLCLREADGSTTDTSDRVAEYLPIVGQVFVDRQVMQTTDFSAPGASDFARRYGIGSILLAPVEQRSELLAVLGVAIPEIRALTEEETRLITLFAGEVALHLDRSLQLEAAKALLENQSSTVLQASGGRPVEADEISSLVNNMAAVKSLDEAVSGIPKVIAMLAKASDSAVYVLHESGARIESQAMVDSGCKFPSNVRECPAIRDKKAVGDLAGTEACKFMHMMKRNCLCEPLVQGEHLIGVLQVQGAGNKTAGELVRLAGRSLSSPLAGIRSLEHRESSGFFDKLTEAYSRPFIELQMGYYHRLAKRAGRHYSVIVFGIDGMKAINEQLGMMMGDRTLQGFVEAAMTELGKDEIFGRWHGDLFVACIPEGTKNDVFELTERIRLASVETFSGAEFGHGATISAAIFTSFGGGTLHEVIESALGRLDRAKAFGGNRIEAG